MSDCSNCGHHAPEVVVFVDDICPKCQMPQGKCPRCHDWSAYGFVCDSCRPMVSEVSHYANYFDDILAYLMYGDRVGSPNVSYELILSIVGQDMEGAEWLTKFTKQ